MAGRIHLSSDAIFEIEALADYIAERNIDAALHFYEAVDRALIQLADFPKMGVARQFRNPRLSDIRLWPIPEFPDRLIFYRPIHDGIEVVQVVHAAKDYRRELGPE